jgi:hypothetical protein
MKKEDNIICLIILLALLGLGCMFPVIWGLLFLIGLGYWIVVFFRWLLKG